MTLDLSKLRSDVPNALLLDAVRSSSSTDYQLRIPSADKAGVKQTVAALMDVNNRQWKNEFVDSLVNRIGMVIARSNSWSNPLGIFKSGLLEFGSTIEEIKVGLLLAHNYEPDRDYMEQTLFGRETPEVQTNFHTVNRQDFYKVSINEPLLQRAFIEPTGLASFVNQLMEAPGNSDQLDEFLLTCSLFKEYEANGGFYHVNVPDVRSWDSGGDEARMTLRKIRAMSGNLKFLSTKYNAARMPVFATPDDLVLFATPEFKAAIDVEALAGAFNIDRAEVNSRIVELPQEQFGMDDCQAIMTTSEFFVMADTKYESTSQWNPAALMNNYFLHHWEVISCSRFAPAIMFTTGQDDEVITIHTAPTSVGAITIQPDATGSAPAGIVHGGVVQLASAGVSPAAADQGLIWSITSAVGAGTYITQNGVLHLGAFDPIAQSATITVKAATTDNDPALPTSTMTQSATLAVTVEDGPILAWPNAGVLTGIQIEGELVPAFVPGTHTYALTLPSGTVVEPENVFTLSSGPVDSEVSVVLNGSAPQYTVTIVTQASPSAAVVTYVVNVTTT